MVEPMANATAHECVIACYKNNKLAVCHMGEPVKGFADALVGLRLHPYPLKALPMRCHPGLDPDERIVFGAVVKNKQFKVWPVFVADGIEALDHIGGVVANWHQYTNQWHRGWSRGVHTEGSKVRTT